MASSFSHSCSVRRATAAVMVIAIVLVMSNNAFLPVHSLSGGAACTSNSDCNAPMIAGTNLDNGYCLNGACVCYDGIGGANCNCRSTHSCSGTGVCNDNGLCACHAWGDNDGQSGVYFGPHCECKRDGDACTMTSTGAPGYCSFSENGCHAIADAFELKEVASVSAPSLCDGSVDLQPHAIRPAAGKTLKNNNFVMAHNTCFTAQADGSFVLNQGCLAANYSDYGIIAMFAFHKDAKCVFGNCTPEVFSATGNATATLAFDAAQNIITGNVTWFNVRGCVFGLYFCGCGQCGVNFGSCFTNGYMFYIYQYA